VGTTTIRRHDGGDTGEVPRPACRRGILLRHDNRPADRGAHRIEIWFALVASATDPHPRPAAGPTVYLLAGGGWQADWVRNMAKTPTVTVRIGEQTFGGRARIVSDPAEDATARDLLVAKYQASYGGDLTNWRHRALAVAVDLHETGSGPIS
jgi:hypothetical protein